MICFIICHDDFRPMDKGSTDKLQLVRTKIQCITFFDNLSVWCNISTIQILQHVKRHGRCHNSCFRILFQESRNACRVIRLHMLHDQICRFVITQYRSNVTKPFFRKMAINRIHDGSLFINNNIRIVCHAFRYDILTFKQIDIMVIDTDITNILCDFHVFFPFSIRSLL